MVLRLNVGAEASPKAEIGVIGINVQTFRFTVQLVLEY